MIKPLATPLGINVKIFLSWLTYMLKVVLKFPTTVRRMLVIIQSSKLNGVDILYAIDFDLYSIEVVY